MEWQKAMAAAKDQSSTRSASRLRARILAAVGGSAGVFAITMIVVGVSAPVHAAIPAPTPRLVQGNVQLNDCAAAGLEGEGLFGADPAANVTDVEGSGTIDAVTKTMTVTINSGWTATGIVVKGGSNTNVYDGPFVGPVTVEGLVSPDNASGMPAGISHWFVCGEESDESPSPSSSPSPSTETSTTTGPPTTPTTPGGGLPVTGASIGGLITVGVLMVTAGAGLMLLRRRRDATDGPAS